MESTSSQYILQLTKATAALSIAESLAFLAETFPRAVVFSTSFSYEDQIVTNEILSNQIPIKIFTLD
ncbi:hypothetical protein, partial [Staphylococcus aureus]